MATPDLTEAELTQWLQQYDAHPDIPEHPAQSVDLSNWLHSEDFDASRVVKKEMEGGLNGYGIILENVFSRRECQKIIQATEEVGFGHLGQGNTGAAYRGNRRLQIDDSSLKLGEEIWRRIKEFIPADEDIPDEGSCTFQEMNSRYRFAKYFAGDGFAIHVDKPTIYEKEVLSIYTVNIYLNDLTPEQAGRTRFFTKMTGGKLVDAAGGTAGSVAIFKQAIVPYSPIHDGEKLESGLKYLMRTDIVYKIKN